MKQIIFSSVLVGMLTVLTGCPDNGGGGNKAADVPGPQGVVEAYGNSSIYCQFGSGSFNCAVKNQASGLEICRTQPRPFTDLPSLCQQVREEQATLSQYNNNCNVQAALQRVVAETCQNVASPATPILPGQPTYPGQTGNEYEKSITCTYTGYNNGYRAQPVTLPIPIAAKSEVEISFNNKYFYIDIGRFGTTTMVYTPGKRGIPDTITLKNVGLNNELSFSQSGYAGEEVRLKAKDDRGRTSLEITCAGAANFKKNIVDAKFTKYVCVGTSNLRAARGQKETINITLPYDSRLTDSEIQLASGLSARIIGDDTNRDKEQIEFTAYGVGLDYTVTSASYLKTKSTFRAKNGHRGVNISCVPQ